MLFIANVNTYSSHIGKNHLGHTFGQAFSEYEKVVIGGYDTFLANVYCE